MHVSISRYMSIKKKNTRRTTHVLEVRSYGSFLRSDGSGVILTLSRAGPAHGSPTLARKLPGTLASKCSGPCQSLLGHLGKPWMAQQGGVCVSRWLL